jgi:hypothetical protein
MFHVEQTALRSASQIFAAFSQLSILYNAAATFPLKRLMSLFVRSLRRTRHRAAHTIRAH